MLDWKLHKDIHYKLLDLNLIQMKKYCWFGWELLDYPFSSGISGNSCNSFRNFRKFLKFSPEFPEVLEILVRNFRKFLWKIILPEFPEILQEKKEIPEITNILPEKMIPIIFHKKKKKILIDSCLLISQ